MQVQDFYIDFACRLGPTWKRYVDAQPAGSERLQAMKELRVMVNWMHGSAHELSCELQNSGRYKEGAARRVGENVEQLWALLKVCKWAGGQQVGGM